MVKARDKKDAYYFSHDSNARNDEKILALRIKYGWDGYGIFWALVERLREAADYTSVCDYNLIAYDLREDAAKIKSIINDFGLFAFTEDGKCFYSERLNHNMELMDDKHKKLSQAGKRGNEIRWAITEGSPPDRHPIASKVKESKVKEKEREAGEPPSTTDELLKRERKFYNELAAYVQTYGKDMIRAFYDHWREPNKSKSKMKWEQERTWDIKLRLKKWESNEFKFSKNGHKKIENQSSAAPLKMIND